MAEDLPKKDLLIKLMGKSTSDNDNEALMALRAANKLLSASGWSWESLIQGKIKVIEDPFKSIFDPSSNQRPRPAAPQPPPPRQPQPKPAQSNPQSNFQYAGARTGRWSSSGRTISPHSTKTNIYRGVCYCCGIEVQPSAGFIFNPNTINRLAADKWKILCAHCNNSAATVPSSPAKRVFPSGYTDLGSL